MNKPHKHAEVIKAWADGAEVQTRSDSYHDWYDIDLPVWYPSHQYRVKPEPVITKMYMHYDNIERKVATNTFDCSQVPQVMHSNKRDLLDHIEFTFTDGKLTNVEMKDATN
jgi:hypothetical protein